MKTSKRSNVCILIALFLSSNLLLLAPARCQKNYLPGVVISLKGDTLKGFIDYLNWEKNPDKISFKDSESSEEKEFNPLMISEFRVHNEVYVSAIVQAEDSHQLEYSPNQIKESDYDPEIKTRTDTTFLQSMFRGTKNLYYSYDKKGKPQFYIKQNPDFELLIYKKYLKNNTSKINANTSDPINVYSENKKFIGQLMLYLQDCPTLQEQTNKLQYDSKSLENLFNAYYECEKSEPTYKYTREKTKVDFGVLAGISATKLIMISSDPVTYKYVANVDNPVSVNFSGGLLMDVVLARNQRRWSVYNELIISSFSVSQHFEEHFSEENFSIIDTKIGFSYLKLNSMLRYKYLVKDKWFLFTNLGLSMGRAFAEENSRIRFNFWGVSGFKRIIFRV
ncbi:MAG: outer membrane beta-barrel protein, partial [Bacteroidota bacterium]